MTEDNFLGSNRRYESTLKNIYQGLEIQTNCTLCGSPASAVFKMPKGCVCSDKQIQFLCMQHIVRATPLGGMYLLEIIDDNWKEELIKRFGEPDERN